MIRSAENRRATSQGKTFPVGEAGFTLIELLITISIMAILLAVAVPSFQNVALSSKLTSQANNFVASVQLARSEAIKRNATVTLCASSDGSTCTGAWKDGWVVRAGGAVVYRQGALPNGFLLVDAGSLTSLDFKPSGVGATAADLTLCRSTPDVGSRQRVIRVSATGRPGVEKVTGATTCP
jgi:type IV fimbrial biogenesis protein FimT